MSPGIRDPKLNTAECIIEGNETDIKATGRSPSIRAILWMSFLFACASCPVLANFLDEKCKLAWPKPETQNDREAKKLIDINQAGNKNSAENLEKNKLDQIAAKTICILCYVFVFIGSCILLVALGFSFYFCFKRNSPPDIIIVIILLFVWSGFVFWLRKRKLQGICWCSVFLTICATEISYFSCWLLIGIMINPTWGLTVTLLVSFNCATFAYAEYGYLNTTEHKDQVRIWCVCILLAVIFVTVVIVIAGQSYNGRETADETLKTALLYIIGGLASWVSWKWPSTPDEQTSKAKLERMLKSLLERTKAIPTQPTGKVFPHV